MVCTSFEDLLLDYQNLPLSERGEVDVHLSGCADCREYLTILAQLDAELTRNYSGLKAPSNLQTQIRLRISAERRLTNPSFLPEVLDFIGWSGVVAIAGTLVWKLAPVAAVSWSPELPLW